MSVKPWKNSCGEEHRNKGKEKAAIFNPEARKHSWMIALIIALFILLVAVFLVLDRSNAVSLMIQELGWFGSAAAVLIMALLCMTPVPSEGLIILYLKIYGVFWGVLLGWAGSVISAVAIYIIADFWGPGC
jgi:uncharacterized membrane protein YdjX (TVP38/TMEM64 family)